MTPSHVWSAIQSFVFVHMSTQWHLNATLLILKLLRIACFLHPWFSIRLYLLGSWLALDRVSCLEYNTINGLGECVDINDTSMTQWFMNNSIGGFSAARSLFVAENESCTYMEMTFLGKLSIFSFPLIGWQNVHWDNLFQKKIKGSYHFCL